MTAAPTDQATIKIPTMDEGTYEVGVRLDRKLSTPCGVNTTQLIRAACGHETNNQSSNALKDFKERFPSITTVLCAALSL